jgi:hypothetical protein
MCSAFFGRAIADEIGSGFASFASLHARGRAGRRLVRQGDDPLLLSMEAVAAAERERGTVPNVGSAQGGP